MQVFAQRGLAATMDDIAERAQVGVGTVYRRFPDKAELIEALFEKKIGEMAELAERGAEFDDPWGGLEFFFVEASLLHHHNRALRDLLFGGTHSSEWLARGRAKMRPRVQKLLDRARKQGTLRGDLDPFDVPLILMMLTAVMDYTAAASPEVWRRQLQLILDGLVVRRDKPSPLPAKPLTGEELQIAMASWKAS
jgi:AcrR family transcriptional regulator